MTRPTGRLIHKDLWDNTLVEIIDQGNHRSLYFGRAILQSRMSLASPEQLLLIYTRFMMISLLTIAPPQRVLLIGVGAGSLIRFLHHHFPTCRIDAVDNSPHIIKIAKGYFQLPENDRVHIHCCDGMDYIANRAADNRYDMILVDAFDETGMADNIYTKEFFSLCAARLSKNGVVCSNLWSGRPGAMAAIQNILKACFPSQLYLHVTERGNVIGLSFNGPVPWHRFNRPKTELIRLSQHYGIDFITIINLLKKENLNLRQRLSALFS